MSGSPPGFIKYEKVDLAVGIGFVLVGDDRLVPEPFRSQLQSVGVASVHAIWGGNAFRVRRELDRCERLWRTVPALDSRSR